MSLAAGIITLAQTPGALSAAAAAATMTPSLPTAQGPCPIGGSAPRFQIRGRQLSLRAFTEPAQAARSTAGRGRQRQSQTESGRARKGKGGSEGYHPLTYLSQDLLNLRSLKSGRETSG